MEFAVGTGASRPTAFEELAEAVAERSDSNERKG